jgi:hypothetical protein
MSNLNPGSSKKGMAANPISAVSATAMLYKSESRTGVNGYFWLAFGLRQSSGAFRAGPKRQRTAALQMPAAQAAAASAGWADPPGNFNLPTARPFSPTAKASFPTAKPKLPTAKPSFPTAKADFPTAKDALAVGKNGLAHAKARFPGAKSPFPHAKNSGSPIRTVPLPMPSGI